MATASPPRCARPTTRARQGAGQLSRSGQRPGDAPDVSRAQARARAGLSRPRRLRGGARGVREPRARPATSTHSSRAASCRSRIAIRQGGRDTLDALLKEAGHARPRSSCSRPRVRAMLAGDHAGAASLLATAESHAERVRMAARSRARPARIRRGNDIKAATERAGRALEGCGSDAETFLLAADASRPTEDKSGLAKHRSSKKLAPERLKGLPEAQDRRRQAALAEPERRRGAVSRQRASSCAPEGGAAPDRAGALRLAVVAYNKQHDPEAMDDSTWC